ncbi:MAG: DUF1501 domain-containing protein [Planctomycetaceae bacterium]|nr:DUF1501 domain-containing protein [Planctomycetaceae bacterium]
MSAKDDLFVPGENDRRVSRREALWRGVLGSAGLLAANHFSRKQSRAAEAPSPPAEPAAASASSGPPPAKAKAVIQIWMWGGPPHTDTFDPKPDAGSDYTGPLTGAIETNVSGIRLGAWLPELAKVADKYSIIRSMTHGQFGHETAAYMVQTGRMPGGRLVFPSVGAVVTAFKAFQGESESLIPPYIVLTQPQGRFSEAGFMGIRYKPFATGGNPNAARFAVEGIIAPGISDSQQQERRNLLQRANTLGLFLSGDPQLEEAKKAREQAYDLILGDAGKVFDLSEEKDELRLRYGRSTFGQSCLAARRLVEEGVKFVTINYGGWDTHKDHFPAMRRMLPELDKGMGTLIADLADRGLLDTTIVWWGGEFGRTPKIDWTSPWNGGRHHYGHVFSTVVAGGGFKGGQVVGSSDAKGEYVKDRPVYPCDLIGTMYELLGIDPEAGLPHPTNEFVRAVPGPDEGLKMGGRLTEII